MKTNKEIVFDYILHQSHIGRFTKQGFETREIAQATGVSRANVSTILNQLVREDKLEKSDGRPVYYCLKSQPKEKDSFYQYKGYCMDIKNALSIARTAVLYPSEFVFLILAGQEGTGKTFLSDVIHNKAVETGRLTREAPYIKFNCGFSAQDPAGMEEQLRIAFQEASGGILLLKNIDLLRASLIPEVLNRLEKGDIFLIGTVENVTDNIRRTTIVSQATAIIELPPLEKRGILDRLVLIDTFLREESVKTGKEVRVSGELDIALALYRCEGNVKQLKNDIQRGCANAYLRTRNMEEEWLCLTFEDFPAYVRKGFLNYKANKSELSQYLKPNREYYYTKQKSGELPGQENDGKLGNIYETIEKKIDQFEKTGLEEEDILTAVIDEIEENFVTEVGEFLTDKEALSKIVDPAIITLVNQYLRKASDQLHRVYPESIYCGLCIHLNETIKGYGKRHYASNEKTAQIMKEHEEEFRLSLEMGNELEEQLHVHLPMDEIAFITMFFSRNATRDNRKKRPVLLVAMHGETTASSMVSVVTSLTHMKNSYAFDLPMAMPMDEAYERMKALMVQIHQGSGILVLYDMGSLKTFAETISRETGIEVRCLGIPSTLIAIDCSLRLDEAQSLEEAAGQTQESYMQYMTDLTGGYERTEKQKAIIALCRSGEGGAVWIRQYLEKHADVSEYQVIALAMSDRGSLINRISAIMNDHEIICMIGTYDPQLFGIRFIPVSKLVESKNLDALLQIDYEVENEGKGYEIIFENIEEEYPELDMKKMRRHLPRAIVNVSKYVQELNEDQEMGLLMHVASLTARMLSGQPLTPYRESNHIIQKNKKLFYELKEIMKPLEMAYSIEFPDVEYAYMIDIIKIK